MKMKKMMACLLALVTMAAGTCSMATAAQEELAAEVISAEEMVQAQEMLLEAAGSSDTVYYAAYDEYARNELAPTPHFLAGVTTSDAFGTCSVYLYMNANVFTTVPGASMFIVNDANTVIKSLSVTTPKTSLKKLSMDLRINSPLTKGTAAFRCEIVPTGISSEYDIYRFTSWYSDSPTSMIDTSDVDYEMTKIIYALGDTNRDGLVTDEDAQLITKYLVSLMAVQDDRDENGIYDKLAFELAADVNQDGAVTITDVVKLSRYIAGTETLG